MILCTNAEYHESPCRKQKHQAKKQYKKNLKSAGLGARPQRGLGQSPKVLRGVGQSPTVLGGNGLLSKIVSAAILGVDGYLVYVEVDINNGLPSFDIVGLPDSAVKESRDRVRTAVRNSGFLFPVKRITVNLAPADTKKVGPSFDLPIAVGILVCVGILEQKMVDNICFVGELSLDGSVRPIRGVLSMIQAAKMNGISVCCVASQNVAEACLVEGMTVLSADCLQNIIDHFLLKKSIVAEKTAIYENEPKYNVDFEDVVGQQFVKRALEVAAAGHHNVLIIGPPGSGKTMLAHRIPTIMPALTDEESLEITKIYSIVGLLNDKEVLIRERPFRAPHHTASSAALSGGGRMPTPGEISLAHNGILFLDELPEFQKRSLEILRQPLEDGKVTISRVGGTLTYPCKFMLLAAMNPCPCGYFGSDNPARKCNCNQHEIEKYLKKISGPMLDRMDIQIEAAGVKYEEFGKMRGESSKDIRARVMQAHRIQQQRFGRMDESGKKMRNAQMTAPMIDIYCKLGKAESELMQNAFNRLGLSSRAYHKILKLARTIADLEMSSNIEIVHLTEALSYRSLDRKYW